ncbi:MAG: DUF3566 domain-containing protein [Frankiaceae bacterium]
MRVTQAGRQAFGYDGTMRAGGSPAARPGPHREVPRQRGARSARLLLRRVEPLSVLRVALVAALGFVVAALVIVTALYALLDVMGVLDAVGGLSQDVGATRTGAVVPLGAVVTWTAVVSVSLAVVAVAAATVTAYVYNLVGSLVGGPELTLTERR